MIVATDTFLVQVDDSKNSTIDVLGINGKKILIDTDYNKYKHARQIGTIYALPIKVSKKYGYETPLEVGDKVVFHHFVCQPNHETTLGKNIYRCEYFHIYGKIIGDQIIPLEDVIFVEPIVESDSDMFCGVLQTKLKPGYLNQQGIVLAASKRANKLGVLSGDKVFFTKDADYLLPVFGGNLYRMRIRNIVATERNNELNCLADRILIKEIAEDNKEGVLDSLVEKTQRKGEIVFVGADLSGVKVGDIASYYNGVNGSFYRDGVKYAFIELRNINFLIMDGITQKPILDRIIIKQDEAAEKAGILYVSDTAKEKPKSGTVVAIGPGLIFNGVNIPVTPKVGDRVVYGQFAGAEVTIDGAPFVVLKESDLYFIE